MYATAVGTLGEDDTIRQPPDYHTSTPPSAPPRSRQSPRVEHSVLVETPAAVTRRYPGLRYTHVLAEQTVNAGTASRPVSDPFRVWTA